MPGIERRAPYEGRRPVGIVWLECTGWGLLSLILSPPPPPCVMPNHFNRIHGATGTLELEMEPSAFQLQHL